MPKVLLVNRTALETRVAVLEDGHPVELHVEPGASRSLVGNIYRGRVVRVLAGMQAAFVEIGEARTGFLYVDEATSGEGDGDASSRRSPQARIIAEHVKVGQELLVQVQKDPMGTKGARLTRHVTIPGRHLVYTPLSSRVGISTRITREESRERLRQVMATAAAQHGGGYIVRTAAEGASDEVLLAEAAELQRAYAGVLTKQAQGGGSRLIYRDLDVALRAVRDAFGADTQSIVVDDREDYERLRSFVATFGDGAAADRLAKVTLHNERKPLFDQYGIEQAIERSLQRRVWLPSGGHLIVDETEGLTVIDVNTGRFVGSESLEDTTSVVNLEAAVEVARQLRFRNIGGIIIIDFIDMELQSNRERVLGALESALARDRAKCTILGMSSLGLVKMTRKRVRESLGQLLLEPCGTCKGQGRVKAVATVAREILRGLQRTLSGGAAPTVVVSLHPAVAEYLRESATHELERLEGAFGTRVTPVPKEGLARDHYEITPRA